MKAPPATTPSPNPMPGRSKAPEEHVTAPTRERLMEAGLAEFTEHRFADASLNRIIERASASKGSFYHHFQDKQHLYAEVLIRASRTILGNWQVDAATDLSAETYWDGVRRRTEASARAFCRHPEFMPLWRHFQEDYRHLQADDRMRSIMAVGQKTLADLLERGVALGLVRSDLSVMQLAELYESVDRVIDSWFFLQADVLGVEAAMQRQVDLIVDLLRRLTEAR